MEREWKTFLPPYSSFPSFCVRAFFKATHFLCKMTKENAVFWNMMTYDSCKNQRFGRTYYFLHQVAKISEPETKLSVTSNSISPRPPNVSHWWWRRYVPLKRRFLHEPHGLTFQKTTFFNIFLFHCIKWRNYCLFFSFLGWGETQSSGHVGHHWTCCTSPRWLWVWRSLWNEWQGKSKWVEKTCSSGSLSTTNLTCPDLGWKPWSQLRESRC
jgi:hypothetical protein